MKHPNIVDTREIEEIYEARSNRFVTITEYCGNDMATIIENARKLKKQGVDAYFPEETVLNVFT